MICVFILVIFRPSVAALAARHSHTTPRSVPQQIEVLFLSSLDPDMPDVAAMIEQTETQILIGSDKPVRFSFDYLDFSSSLSDAPHKKATAFYLADKYRGATFQLVIAIGEDTLTFAEQTNRSYFGRDPFVFIVNPKEESDGLRQERIGRRYRKSGVYHALQFALRQSRNLRVIVVAGTSDGEKLQMNLAAASSFAAMNRIWDLNT